MKTLGWRTALVLLAVLGAACSDSTKVGGGIAVSDKPSAESCRLGECTTTTAPPSPTTTAPPKTTRTTLAALVTRAPGPTTTTAPRQAEYVIKIYPDSAGHQFQPRQATVRKGTLVRWTNTDSVARSVEADNGEFVSPLLAPGASWEYTAEKLGSFNYHDGTRPFAVASLDVVT